MDKHTKDKTAFQYIHRKAPSSVTPTFRYLQAHIVGRTLDIGMRVGKYLEKIPNLLEGTGISELNSSAKETRSILKNADFFLAWYFV